MSKARYPKTAVGAELKKLGVDPFAELVRLAQSTDDEALAAKIWVELAQYLAPRLRSIALAESVTVVSPPPDAIRRAKQEVFGFYG
jgi:hypothetical protein